MAELLHLELLKSRKSLLAFSGGVDSSALFFMLLEQNIDFDIAIVNYNTREQSADEESYAIELAKEHNKTCYNHSISLSASNFEHNARSERYKFFNYIMKKHNYDYLLTAHQLDDRLEWAIMQLCRGAGLAEMLGVRSMDSRDDITIIRPLLEFSKSELLEYLEKNGYRYFIDSTNQDEKYRRNYFRKHITSPLLEQYSDGVKNSFRYLSEDYDEIFSDLEIIKIDEFAYIKNPSSLRNLLYNTDRYFKSIGYLMSSNDKELLKSKKVAVLFRKYVVHIDKNYTFIAPYIKDIVMEKWFKEECRKLIIHPHLRGYLYDNPNAFSEIKKLLNQ